MKTKTATHCLLGLLAAASAYAAPTHILTATGILGTVYFNETTNPVLQGAEGSAFTYTVMFSTGSADTNPALNQADYTFSSSAGFFATLTFNGITFSNSGTYSTSLVIENDFEFSADRMEFDTPAGVQSWSQHGVEFSDGQGWSLTLSGPTGLFADASTQSLAETDFGNYSTFGYISFFGVDTFGEPGFNFLTASGTIQNISVAAIPEPSAFAAIAGMGVLALSVTRRRR